MTLSVGGPMAEVVQEQERLIAVLMEATAPLQAAVAR